MRAIFLADGNVFTTGFSRMSERQLALWNPVCPVPAFLPAYSEPSLFSQWVLAWYIDCGVLNIVFQTPTYLKLDVKVSSSLDTFC